MTERRTLSSLIFAIVTLGLLLSATLIKPEEASSAPLVQDHTITLNWGDDTTLDRWCTCESSCQQALTVQVNMPAGAQLTVWIQEESRGGCEWMVRLLYGGSEMGRAYAGPSGGDWSDGVSAVIGSGVALVESSALSCPGPYNHYAHIRFKVSDAPTTEATAEPPTIEFWADQTHIYRGQCTNLHWRTENVQAVYYEGNGVSGDDDRQECPESTTTYELYVIVYQAGEQRIDETRQVTIYVEEPPTEAPPPTAHPPTATPTHPPPTATPTARPPTATPTRQPPTPTLTRRPPTATPTASPSAATPTRRPPTPTPTRRPTASPQPPASPPWLLVVTHSDALEAELGPGAWPTIGNLLIGRYGQENLDILDLFAEAVDRANWGAVDVAIQNRVQTYGGLPSFILIMGGPEIVAFGTADNPLKDDLCCASPDPAVRSKCDCDTIFTDDPYGDFTDDGFPDVPTARLPDGGDIGLYTTQFSLPEGRTNASWGSGMVIANVERPYGQDFADLLGTTVQWSAPVNMTTNSFPTIATGQNAYFILHGSGFNPREWLGDNMASSCPQITPVPAGPPGLDATCYYDRYPLAWDATWAQGAGSQGTVVSGACYGAFIGLPRTVDAAGNVIFWPVPVNDSIALTYLRSGAEAFMGHTASHYSYVFSAEVAWCLPWPLDDVCGTSQKVEDWPVTEGAQAIEWFAMSSVANGEHPLIAYHQAKGSLANSLGGFEEELYGIEEKALHSFVFYGLPPAPLTIEF
jgi:hypothetical protein